MSVDRKELKRQAKQVMREARPAPYWVVLLLFVILMALELLNMSLSGRLDALRAMYASAANGRMTFVAPAASGGLLGGLLQVALDVMSMELTVGYIVYTMRVWRREKAGCGDLFDGFGVFFRSIWIQLLPSLFVSLWSLIYVVPVTYLVMITGQTWWLAAGLPLLLPAIMATYAYRQATYLMLDNPNMGCYQCIALSREIMRGHKWELFKVDLSFAGWALLCAILPLIGLLLIFWVAAYMQVTLAGYYERVTADFMSRNAPPMEPQPPEV